MVKGSTIRQLKDAQEKLHGDGWSPKGPDPKQIRDVLDEVITALLEETSE